MCFFGVNTRRIDTLYEINTHRERNVYFSVTEIITVMNIGEIKYVVKIMYLAVNGLRDTMDSKINIKKIMSKIWFF